MSGLSWHDFIKIEDEGGRIEVYIVGAADNERRKMMISKTLDFKEKTEISMDFVQRLDRYSPVKKRQYWYQIFERGKGYIYKKNGRPYMVHACDLPCVLTKLYNNEMEEM